MKILIVDDNAMMRTMVRQTLGEAGFDGHEIVEAADGVAAMMHVAATPFDLVLSDWSMPNMTGLGLLRALRAAGDTTPFVFVTSDGSPDARWRAMLEGAVGLIEKPFTVEAFKLVLANHLR